MRRGGPAVCRRIPAVRRGFSGIGARKNGFSHKKFVTFLSKNPIDGKPEYRYTEKRKRLTPAPFRARSFAERRMIHQKTWFSQPGGHGPDQAAAEELPAPGAAWGIFRASAESGPVSQKKIPKRPKPLACETGPFPVNGMFSKKQEERKISLC